MTDLELAADRARALAHVGMLPGSSQKRFARNADAQVAAGIQPLSERQAAYLAILAWTFRRQLPPRLVPAEKPPVLPPRPRATKTKGAPEAPLLEGMIAS